MCTFRVQAAQEPPQNQTNSARPHSASTCPHLREQLQMNRRIDAPHIHPFLQLQRRLKILARPRHIPPIRSPRLNPSPPASRGRHPRSRNIRNIFLNSRTTAGAAGGAEGVRFKNHTTRITAPSPPSIMSFLGSAPTLLGIKFTRPLPRERTRRSSYSRSACSSPS